MYTLPIFFKEYMAIVFATKYKGGNIYMIFLSSHAAIHEKNLNGVRS